MPCQHEGHSRILRVDQDLGSFDLVTGGHAADRVDDDFRVDGSGDGVDEELVEVKRAAGDVVKSLVPDIGQVLEQVDVDSSNATLSLGAEADRVDPDARIGEAVQVGRVAVVGREVSGVFGQSRRVVGGNAIGEEYQDLLAVGVTTGGQKVIRFQQGVGHVRQAVGHQSVHGRGGG